MKNLSGFVCVGCGGTRLPDAAAFSVAGNMHGAGVGSLIFIGQAALTYKV